MLLWVVVVAGVVDSAKPAGLSSRVKPWGPIHLGYGRGLFIWGTAVQLRIVMQVIVNVLGAASRSNFDVALLGAASNILNGSS